MGLMIGAFIIILIGVVLIDSIADSVSELDDIDTLGNNESIAWAGNNTPITLANDDIVANSETVYNQTTKLTRGTDYSMTSSSITLINQTDTSGLFVDSEDTHNPINISYNHEGNNYLNDSTSRGLINLTILFFALAILGVGYLIVVRAYNQMNM